jgi:agmatinase
MAFWSARGDLPHSRVVILGVPLEQTTTGVPGTRLGPDRIRQFSENVESYSPYFKKDLADYSISDAGNIEFDYLPTIEEKLELLLERISGYLKQKTKPLLVGGEHTLALGAVRAMVAKYPDLAVLQLDAHADLRDIGESGSLTAHDTVMRRALELLKPDSLVQAGIRSMTRDEAALSQSMTMDMRDVDGIRKRLGKRPVWLTFDLDVLDPSIMPAVGTPEPMGASYKELIDLLVGLNELNFVGADIVEFNPLAADFAAPAITAANLVREVCCLLA